VRSALRIFEVALGEQHAYTQIMLKTYHEFDEACQMILDGKVKPQNARE
jgi:hypothetical protein